MEKAQQNREVMELSYNGYAIGCLRDGAIEPIPDECGDEAVELMLRCSSISSKAES